MPSFYSTTVPPLLRGLQNSAAYIAYAEEFAKTNNIEPKDLLHGSLAPDMKDFTFQVHTFTAQARNAVNRVTGRGEAPPTDSTPDIEASFSDLIAEIQDAVKYLEGFKEEDFEGKEERRVELSPRAPDGKRILIEFTALDYLNTWAVPTFWFHITTAYGILRSKGVDLGKVQYLNAAGGIEFKVLDE